MDLGIKGRRAIVCAASKGLGKACAMALAREGVEVTIAARTADVLEATAKEIREQTGAKVTAVAVDVTTEEGRAQLLAACKDPDILINNAGGPPTGDFRKFTREDWLAAVNGNMLTAIELIKATIDPMIERKFGRIVNITSHTVKEPAGPLGLSNGARAGLTGFVSGVAREVAHHNVIINNLLPGQFETDRLRSNMSKFAEKMGKTTDELMEIGKKRIPVRRFGQPEEFGAMCAYLCSAHVGYFIAQNVLLDGGQFPGLL
jgi:3-oxoacyl-[acyl-carrier protein] reductase